MFQAWARKDYTNVQNKRPIGICVVLYGTLLGLLVAQPGYEMKGATVLPISSQGQKTNR